MRAFTPTQSKALIALGEFTFLTSSQMIQLGIATKRSNLYTAIKPLIQTRFPLVKVLAFGTDPVKGKLENFYYLTRRASRLMIENNIVDYEEVRFPRGTSSLFRSDYFHRKYTIDCHIECKLACEQQEIFLHQFDRYFDKTGNNRIAKNLKAKTSITYPDGYVIADGSFLISKREVSRLYALELYNDRNTKRIIAQLKKHIEGIRASSLSEHFGLKKSHRVCCVFTHEGTMKAVMEKFEGGDLEEYFLFKISSATHHHFIDDWSLLNGSHLSLF